MKKSNLNYCTVILSTTSGVKRSVGRLAKAVNYHQYLVHVVVFSFYSQYFARFGLGTELVVLEPFMTYMEEFRRTTVLSYYDIKWDFASVLEYWSTVIRSTVLC